MFSSDESGSTRSKATPGWLPKRRYCDFEPQRENLGLSGSCWARRKTTLGGKKWTILRFDGFE